MSRYQAEPRSYAGVLAHGCVVGKWSGLAVVDTELGVIAVAVTPARDIAYRLNNGADRDVYPWIADPVRPC